MRHTTSSRIRTAVAALAAAVALVGLAAAPARAEIPETVRDGLTDSGVFVADGSVDPAPLEAVVAEGRAAGYDPVIVVASDPRPTASGFALRVRQLEVGDPVLVFGPDGEFGVSSEVIERTDLFRARQAAEEAEGPAAQASAFVAALEAEPDEGVSGIVGGLVRVVLIAVVVLGVAIVAEQALRAARRRGDPPLRRQRLTERA